MPSVFSVIQCLYVPNDVTKSILDDLGQKLKHNPAQFELNRKFSRAHNPNDESMTSGPGIYENYKHQVNTYGSALTYADVC